MATNRTINSYISSNQWSGELKKLREIILKKKAFKEALKWGTPHYTIDGKNLVGLAGFKAYVGIWFHQGVFLNDPQDVLVNAQAGTTKGLRQWRFNSIHEIDETLVSQYLDEVIANHKKGKTIAHTKKKMVLEPELKTAFINNTQLKDAFDKLSPGKQREYAEHIAQAKRMETRISRIEKIKPMIIRGEGLNDKYKK
ncbi:MAG: DUF1801 domain-containing protein [Salibacteraceae bacterium]